MGWGKKPKIEPPKVATLPPPAPPPEVPYTDDWQPVTQPNIGKSLHVQGEVTGRENVTIDGSVDGKITLDEHTLTVGPTAVIHAEIHARSVVIHGKVVGNVTADDRVEITSTGSLQGNIVAARVVLMDNSQFRGSIDTGGEWSAEPAAAPARATAPTPAPRAPSTATPTASPATLPADAQPAAAADAKVGDLKASKSSLLKALNWGDSQLKK